MDAVLNLMFAVGVTLVLIFAGIYIGGRKTLKDWGHECPRLIERNRTKATVQANPRV